jgi:phage baseplate assembly protein W
MHLSEEKPILGKDVRLVETEQGADLKVSPSGDLELVGDELNLGQAIVHRVRTRLGELVDIGHADYGSRLFDMIGEPNNETTRERVKTIIRETLELEPRIKEIVNISATSSPERADVVNVEVSVIAVGMNIPLNIVFPFYLEVA